MASAYKMRLFVCVCCIYMTLGLSHSGLSQDRCGMVEYNRMLNSKNLRPEKDASFEQWVSEKITERHARLNSEESFVQIPVVVHIIHRGESVGVGTNISDDQVRSQISVLNKDFNRLNTDTLNTPSEFRSVAGRFRVEFVLAKQNPQGQATSGIIRVKGSKNTWTVNDDSALKATSYWPAENYLNIWVTDLSSSLLGYAQFPVSTLAGLEGANTNRLTDGVVIDYHVFGSIDDGNFNLNTDFNKGRAATHEIGHFFGLRHIWGDDNGNCGGNGDYVSDTPDQADMTIGCPSHPYSTCGQHTMFQNYMDYTDDDCMNIFTAGQISRMKVVLENSVRRNTLTSSPGLIDPQPLNNDIALTAFVSPQATSCGKDVQVKINVKNNGTNDITTTQLRLLVDGQEKEILTFDFNPSLSIGQSSEVSFTPVQLEPGSHTLQVLVVTTNGVTDAKSNDNMKSLMMKVPAVLTLPIAEQLNGIPSNWTVVNADQSVTWSTRMASHSTSGNEAAYMNFFQYQNGVGQIDKLITPRFDLSTASSAYVAFDVAYARYQQRSDGLKIFVISDCSTSSQGVEVYSKSGTSLATVSSTTAAFVPSSSAQWRTEVIDLSAFRGQQNLQLAFVGINDRGNNLYIDNIQVVKDVFEDLAIERVVSPSPVVCRADVSPSLIIRNKGNVAVSGFKVVYFLNDAAPETISFSDVIMPGESLEVTLPNTTVSDVENTFRFKVMEPNGAIDISPDDNSITMKVVVNQMTDKIPYKVDFQTNDWTSLWTNTNAFSETKWEGTSASDSQLLYYDAYHNEKHGDQAWLVTPVLDFSNTTYASVFFDMSYRNRNEANDRFQILAARNCSNGFDEVLFDRSGIVLSSGLLESSSWKPTSLSHWTRSYISLSAFAGEEKVRLAFVFTNANGNNFYLDNIEFFVQDDPSPVSVADDLYRIYKNVSEGLDKFYLTFNLPTRQLVRYQLIDGMGRLVEQKNLPDVLNQTYSLASDGISSGLYVVRLFIDNKWYMSRVYMN